MTSPQSVCFNVAIVPQYAYLRLPQFSDAVHNFGEWDALVTGEQKFTECAIPRVCHLEIDKIKAYQGLAIVFATIFM